jgi:plasmid stabilization system protein ParE
VQNGWREVRTAAKEVVAKAKEAVAADEIANLRTGARGLAGDMAARGLEQPGSSRAADAKLQGDFREVAPFPESRQRAPELAIGIRSFPTGKYVVLYQPADEVLEIVRVRHGATKLDELFEVE